MNYGASLKPTSSLLCPSGLPLSISDQLGPWIINMVTYPFALFFHEYKLFLKLFPSHVTRFVILINDCEACFAFRWYCLQIDRWFLTKMSNIIECHTRLGTSFVMQPLKVYKCASVKWSFFLEFPRTNASKNLTFLCWMTAGLSCIVLLVISQFWMKYTMFIHGVFPDFKLDVDQQNL